VRAGDTYAGPPTEEVAGRDARAEALPGSYACPPAVGVCSAGEIDTGGRQDCLQCREVAGAQRAGRVAGRGEERSPEAGGDVARRRA
jgi:hypothetical protein